MTTKTDSKTIEIDLSKTEQEDMADIAAGCGIEHATVDCVYGHAQTKGILYVASGPDDMDLGGKWFAVEGSRYVNHTTRDAAYIVPGVNVELLQDDDCIGSPAPIQTLDDMLYLLIGEFGTRDDVAKAKRLRQTLTGDTATDIRRLAADFYEGRDDTDYFKRWHTIGVAAGPDICKDMMTIYCSARCANPEMVTLALNLLAEHVDNI